MWACNINVKLFLPLYYHFSPLSLPGTFWQSGNHWNLPDSISCTEVHLLMPKRRIYHYLVRPLKKKILISLLDSNLQFHYSINRLYFCAHVCLYCGWHRTRSFPSFLFKNILDYYKHCKRNSIYIAALNWGILHSLKRWLKYIDFSEMQIELFWYETAEDFFRQPTWPFAVFTLSHPLLISLKSKLNIMANHLLHLQTKSRQLCHWYSRALGQRVVYDLK